MDPVEEIKSRLSIDDVVGRTVDLKRSGASLKGLCPFHGEKTPSFYVTPNRGTFHCFGCGRGGDIFTFVMESQSVPFVEALKELAGQAGVQLPEREPKKSSYKTRLYEANEAALLYFTESLKGARGERSRQYLLGRQFGREAVDLFGLGYAPDGHELLVRHLKEKGFDDSVLLAAGLAYAGDDGQRSRDRFRDRLMFPIRDAGGRVTGFGGRLLGDGQPKYLNSPQTEVFDKSGVLYGINLAEGAIRDAGKAVLVEGYLDAVRAHLGGFRNTVASLGTAVTTQQLLLLGRYTETVILALDPDPAGQSAAARTSITALAEVMRVRGKAGGSSGSLDLRIARLPAGHGDPDDLIREHPDLWEEAISQSVPAFDFYFDRTMDSFDRSTNTWRQWAIDTLLPMIQQFAGSTAWVAAWIERLAVETGIPAAQLQRAMPNSSTRKDRRAPQKQSDAMASVLTSTTARGIAGDAVTEYERGLLALLLRLVVVPPDAEAALDGVELQLADHKIILETLLAWTQNSNYDYEMYRETLPERLHELADTLHARPIPLPDDGKSGVAVEFHLARIRQARIIAQFSRASQLLADIDPADQATQVEHVMLLMQERADVDRALEQLSQAVAQSPVISRLAHGTIDHDSGNR